MSIPWLPIVSLVLVLFLYAPLVIAVLFAFNSANSLTWPLRGLSLRWFELIFSTRDFQNALNLSFTAAIVTSILATVVGAAAAMVFTRTRSRLSGTVEALGRLPVMLPPLFMGIGLVALMKISAMTPSLVTIVIGHTLVVVPFVILVVQARMRTFDVELELAARDLGAGPWQVLARVTIPLVAPALFGAAVLAFAWSFDETMVTNFTSGIQSTVPIYVLGRLHRSADPGANAVAVILLFIPWFAFAVGHLGLRRFTGTGLTEALMQRVG
jgi:ABC-type spermidine/putrescine transport system permease subunit II